VTADPRLKANWINFYRVLCDGSKRGSLGMRIWRHAYLGLSQLISGHSAGRALPPPELNVEISSWCNLRCRMCPSRVHEQKMHPRPDIEAINAIILRLGVKTVRFSGLGEPMMAPAFWDMVETAHRNGCRIAMVTNGTLLDEDAVVRLSAMSRMLCVSLDSATSETYKYIRSKDEFENVYDAIRRLYIQKSCKGRSLPVIAINWVLMKSNYGELPLLIKKLRGDGIRIDMIHCDPLVAYSQEMSGEVLPVHFEGLAENLEEIRSQALSAGIYFEYPYYERNTHPAGQSGGKTNGASCGVLWESLFLNLHQQFLPCCEYYLNPIGSMRNMDAGKAWNSRIMREARIRSLRGQPPFSHCIHCHKYAGKGNPSTMVRRASSGQSMSGRLPQQYEE
jgi:MoaA/NifB/PqqE/SkfB family radical SAM enzyme